MPITLIITQIVTRMPYCHNAYLVAEVNMVGCVEFGLGLSRGATPKGHSGLHNLTPIQGTGLRHRSGQAEFGHHW